MFKEYTFTEATPFLKFLEEHRNEIIGQRMKSFYLGSYYEDSRACLGTDNPIVVELEKFSIAIQFFWLSDITLTVFDTEMLKNDRDLRFLYANTPYSKETRFPVEEIATSCKGERIKNISIERFTHAFEGIEEHPEGGDYFSTITVTTENDLTFDISGGDAFDDGYIHVQGLLQAPYFREEEEEDVLQ